MNRNLTPEEKLINRTYMEIDGLANELEDAEGLQIVGRSEIIGGCARVLLAAGVNSRVVVNILEQFGDRGKDMIMAIKINEGW